MQASFFTGALSGAFTVAVLLAAYLILLLPGGEAVEEMQSGLARAFRLSRAATNNLLQRPLSSSYFPTTPATFRAFNTTAKMGAGDMSFLDAVKNRRTIYGLDKKTSVSDDKIKAITTAAIKDVPSSFNSQSTRLVVLLKDEHDKFWEIVTTILKAHVPEDKWEHTGQRMDMFKGAYGTVLFYEDPEPIKALQSKFAQYADKFPQWSEHTSAMHQYMIWTALEAEGLGCNLQHYNPLPDQKASDTWGIPLEWSLKAQLVFGNPVDAKREKLAEKKFEPVEKRLQIFGA